MKRRTVVAYAAALMAVALAGCSIGDSSAGGSTDGGAQPGNMSAPEADAPDANPGSEDRAGSDASTGSKGGAGSKDGEGSNDGSGGETAQTDEAAGGVISQVADQAVNRQIIYTIDLEMTTDDVDAAARRAATVARTSGGFVAGETTSEHSATLTLRIPVERHATAVDDLQKLGTVTHRDRSTEDVTDKVVDTESRITSQRKSIARIRALLAEATDLGDVISIESELASREADLDALLSRKEQLADLTALATVTVAFYTTTEAPPDTDDDPAGFLGGLANGWDAFTGTVAVILTVLGVLVPFLTVAAVVGIPLWTWLRRRRPRQPGRPPETPAPLAPPAA